MLALLRNSFIQVIVTVLSLKGVVEVTCLGTTLHLWSLTLCPCRGKQFFFSKSFSDYHNWIYQLFLSGTLTNTVTVSPSAMTCHFTNWDITTTWFNEVFEMSCPSIVTIKLVFVRHYHCSMPVFLLPIKSYSKIRKDIGLKDDQNCVTASVCFELEWLKQTNLTHSRIK